MEKTSDLALMAGLPDALDRSERPVLLPMHPRVANILETRADWRPRKNLRLAEAIGHMDFLALLLNADMIITDSGGVIREAFFAGVRCITPLRGCWWSEAIDSG